MNSEYCIYFDEKPFWIASQFNEELLELKSRTGTVIMYQPDTAIDSAIKSLDSDQAEAVVVITDNTGECWNVFKSNFKFIQAGGGLVKNEADEYLFIFRRGKWDLPKGKLDEGETIKECALREVNEETGLQNVTLTGHLCNTHHVYHEKGIFILKESVWFDMQCSGKQQLTPQTEEDILAIQWLRQEQWSSIYENTFPSIKDVLREKSR